MDTDEDGAVTRQEFDAGSAALWNEFDSNGDGVLDASGRGAAE